MDGIEVENQTHQPVLLEETLNFLAPQDGEVFLDCTVGAGGHAGAILAHSAQIRVIGVDRDSTALRVARQRLAGFGSRFLAIHSNFKQLREILETVELPAVDGIVVDLGVSSLQLKQAARGFSFQLEGPLDMRLDQRQELTAADLVNTLPEKELADILYQFGEEPAARRIARAIVRQRQHQSVQTTTQLAQIVLRARAATRRWRIHPATRTFQALRIAVNNELEGLDRFVATAIDALKPGGRLVIISFHSLEDRIVKRTFKLLAGQCQCPPPLMSFPGNGCPQCGARQQVEILTRKPVGPSQAERAVNPRARSAKLRACRKQTDLERENKVSA